MKHWTEEELLDRLDDPGLDPEDLGPILDELDRRIGPPPAFDRAAGWGDLMARLPQKRRWTLGRLPLAAAIALICLATTAAAAVTVGLHPAILDYFGVGQGQETLVEPGADSLACTVTENGVTLSVLQTMADTYSAYVLFEVMVPQNLPLPEGEECRPGMVFFDPALTPGQGIQGGVSGSDILEREGDRLLILTYFVSDTPIARGPVSLQMRDLVYGEGEQEIVLLAGTWRLEWELTAIDPGITLSPEKPIELAGWSPVVTEINLSPFSLHIYSENSALPHVPIALEFQDGSRLEVDVEDYGHIRSGGHREDASGERFVYDFYYRFYDVIDPAQVTAVVIGETVIPFP
ncbi:MAG: hypothetical protein ACI3VS_09145 [Evtepia sp.]